MHKLAAHDADLARLANEQKNVLTVTNTKGIHSRLLAASGSILAAPTYLHH